MHAIRLLLLLSLGGGAEDLNAGTHLLADFETDEEVVRWRRSGGRRGDRQARVSRSADVASRGRSSLRVVFTKYRKGDPEYVLLEPSGAGKGLNRTDWSGYEAITADYYNPRDEPMSLSVVFRDVTRKHLFKAGVTLRPGWSRVRWSIPAMIKAGGDVARMGTFTMYRRRPKQDYVFHIDNVRLIGGPRERVTEFLRRIKAMRRADKRLSSPPAAGFGRMLDGLTSQLERLRAAGPTSSKQVLAELHRLKERLKTTVAAYRADLADRVAVGAGELRVRERPPVRVTPFHAGRAAEDTWSAEPLQAFIAMLSDRLKEQELKVRLRRQAGRHDLAVGLVHEPFSENLRYRPRAFDGPLVEKVAISAAGNESEPLCLMLIPIDKPLHRVRIAAEAFVREGSADRIAPSRVAIAPRPCL